MNALLATLLPLVAWADEVPKDEDVKAGWVAFALFIGLVLAVALISWALSRSLKRSKATLEAGGYGDSAPSKDDPQP